MSIDTPPAKSTDTPAGSGPDDDTALSILAEVAKRADDDGRVRLYASEIPFFTTTGGTRWLEQVSLEDDAFRITDLGRRALDTIRARPGSTTKE